MLDPADVAAARAPFGRAATLPARAYTDPAIHALERERIFEREWLCVARSDQLARPGDHRPLDLLGRPLLLTRDERGALHVLSRVCRHRGALVAEGAGNAKSLRCPYHGWTYRLDGTLVGTPYMERGPDFDPRDFCLPELPCEEWLGFVFTSFAPDPAPLAPRLVSLARALARYDLAAYPTTEPMCFESAFDWKVLADNFMEAYHHSGTHRDTLEAGLPARRSYALESDGPWSLLVMPPSEAAPASDPHDWPEASVLAVCVFPDHLFTISPSELLWYQLLPGGPGRFDLRVHVCPPRGLAGTAEADALHELVRRVHLQDIGACEATWAGLRSPCYRAGRLGPLERPLWQFGQWWLDRIGL